MLRGRYYPKRSGLRGRYYPPPPEYTPDLGAWRDLCWRWAAGLGNHSSTALRPNWSATRLYSQIQILFHKKKGTACSRSIVQLYRLSILWALDKTSGTYNKSIADGYGYGYLLLWYRDSDPALYSDPYLVFDRDPLVGLTRMFENGAGRLFRLFIFFYENLFGE